MGLFGGCTGPVTKAHSPSVNYTQSQIPIPASSPRTEGSLFSATSAPDLFRDLRAYNIGDIVTIQIVESSQASKNAATDLSRDSNLSGSISALLGYEEVFPHQPNSNFSPSSMLDAKYKSDFKGAGTTSRKESMTAQMSARVVSVLPNGDLVIRGSREIKVNYEKQYMLLQGVIRPSDISADNTVLSSYIADARIEYIGKGVVTDKQRPGWLSRILDKIWPF